MRRVVLITVSIVAAATAGWYVIFATGNSRARVERDHGLVLKRICARNGGLMNYPDGSSLAL
jgi:hypothetical protein